MGVGSLQTRHSVHGGKRDGLGMQWPWLELNRGCCVGILTAILCSNFYQAEVDRFIL